MKKTWKHLFAVVLALALTLSVSVCAFAAEGNMRTFKTIPDTFSYIQSEVHPMIDQGPFTISQATLTENGVDTPVYFIAMHGTETSSFGEAEDVVSDLYAGFDKESQYMKDIKKDILTDVPKGSNLVIAGHSLGGMTAQQLAADPEIKDNSNILYVTAIAAPLLSYQKTEGKVNRLAEKADAVPYMSHYTLSDLDLQKSTRSEEHGSKYNIINSHTGSYKDPAVWGDYDAVGNKGGNAVLTVNTDTTKVYCAPISDRQTGTRAYASVFIDGNWIGVSVLY